ncbi:hypothetical protein [Paenibacillus sp. TCA20]|uniref:hypothetical protein n=1 Tax=Paenibacillus sp. TCA20 TaxID=1499968 RepID=UPI00064C4DDE|nr:hypothetical protein [Paenibacillus sp. TCA20]
MTSYRLRKHIEPEDMVPGLVYEFEYYYDRPGIKYIAQYMHRDDDSQHERMMFRIIYRDPDDGPRSNHGHISLYEGNIYNVKLHGGA